MTAPDTTPSLEPDDEINLLDLLVVLTENIKLLIVFPIVAGLLGLGISFLLTPTFESKAVFAAQKNSSDNSADLVASYLRAPAVLLKAGKELSIAPDLSDARLVRKLEKMVSASISRQDRLLTLTTQGSTPAKAQALNQALWKYALPYTVPQAQDMERLKTRLTAEKERLASGTALEKLITERLQRNEPSENTAQLYSELLTSNSLRLSNIAALETQMEGLTESNLIQRPSLPEEPIHPKKALVAIAAAIAGSLIALLFVFARHALRSASRQPEQARKVQKICNALGIKRR